MNLCSFIQVTSKNSFPKICAATHRAGVKMKPSYRIAFSGLMGLTFSLLACSNGTSVSSAIEEPKAPDTASIKDSILHRNVILYRALNFKGDTTVWKEGDCSISNTSFSCYHETCINGCTYVIRHCVDADNKRVKCAGYKDTIYDTTYKDINFGENAIVNYMPVAKIPELDKEAVKKALSILPGNMCAQIFQFSSKYTIESIGLPKDFLWKDKDFNYNHGYAAFLYGDSWNAECSVEPQRVMVNPDPNYPRSIVNRLPEDVSTQTFQLFNGSVQSYSDTTISWKLVYSDLYGRSDTLDVTTKFEAVSADESDSFTTGISGKRFGNCYDATDPKRCK
jgi:hypothetical protein